MNNPELPSRKAAIVTSARDRHNFAEDVRCDRVRDLRGITGSEEGAGGSGNSGEAMDAKTIRVFNESDITSLEVGWIGRSEENGVAIKEIRLHALAGSLKSYLVAAAQDGGAHFREQARIFANGNLRHAHDESPPQRFRLERNGKPSTESSG
jgi:hypothetical protein